MADPQDRPDNTPDTAPEHPPGAGPTPPAPPTPPTDAAPPKPPEHAAEMSTPPAKAPDKPAKKTPAKKAPAKAAKAPKKGQQAAAKKAAAKKGAAKKAPAKKAAAKKAPAKKVEPGAAMPIIQPPTPPRIETNGHLAAAAKDAAAHAKSTVDAASNPVSGEAGLSSPGRSPVPLAVAIVVSLLALLLVRQLRRGSGRDG
jgi:hypothetical protein